jgi:hypothetical protein
MDTSSAPVDVFYHYDSANPNLDGGRLSLALPNGTYHVSLANVYVQHDPTYSPSSATGYLVLDSSETINRGICVVSREGDKRKRGEVAFPLNNPDQARPSTSIYNPMVLTLDETLGVSYYDDSFKQVKSVLRLVVTIHLVKQKS